MKTYPMKARIRNEGSGPARVDIYDDIGAGGWFSEGYTPASFADAIKGVTGPLDIHINSGGGDVADGIAIANAIRGYKGQKRTVVDGMAASIASVIAQAGDERVVEPGAMLMVHDPLTSMVGNEADFLKTAATLGKHGDNLAQQYADRAGGTPEQWRDVMRAETWYTADEAVAAGLADRVGTAAAQLPQGVDVDQLAAHAPARIVAALRVMPRAAAAPEPYTGPDPCPTCKGKKTIRQGNMTCPDCKGTGKAPADSAQAAAAADGDDGGAPSAPKCRTCKGKGRLPHPVTGKNGMQCPSCGGSGTYDPDSAPGDGDGTQDAAAARPRGDAGACCPMCGPDCACTAGAAPAAAGRRVADMTFAELRDALRAGAADSPQDGTRPGPGRKPDGGTDKSVFSRRLEQLRGAMPSLKGEGE